MTFNREENQDIQSFFFKEIKRCEALCSQRAIKISPNEMQLIKKF